MLHFVTDTNSYQSASVAAPAAKVRQAPAKLAQATKATALPAESGPLGLAANSEASPTLIQAADTPLIAKTATDTNCDRVDEVMLNRIVVKNCDS